MGGIGTEQGYENDWLSTCLWVGGGGSATQQNRKLRPLEWGQWSILRSSKSEPPMSQMGQNPRSRTIPTASAVPSVSRPSRVRRTGLLSAISGREQSQQTA